MTDRGRRFVWVAWLLPFLLVTTVPFGAAGSEGEPDLVDPEGDVMYHPVFDGTRSSEYLDILAAWISYDNVTDSFGIHLKTVSNIAVEDPSDEWTVECTHRFQTQGAAAPNGVFEMTHFYQADGPSGSVFWHNEEQPEGQGEPIGHELEVTFDEPGYAVYWIPRITVGTFAESITGIGVSCRETATAADFSVGPITNADNASSSPSISLGEMAEPRFNRTEISDHASAGNSSASEGETLSPGENSPAGGWIGTLVIISTVALAAGRR